LGIAGDPVDLVIGIENFKELSQALRGLLSGFEAKILALYLEGLSYQEISDATSKPQKSVDNAVQRIRRKLARYCLEHGNNR
jgi:RNA polymerase sporulation-specific sigma factor